MICFYTNGHQRRNTHERRWRRRRRREWKRIVAFRRIEIRWFALRTQDATQTNDRVLRSVNWKTHTNKSDLLFYWNLMIRAPRARKCDVQDILCVYINENVFSVSTTLSRIRISFLSFLWNKMFSSNVRQGITPAVWSDTSASAQHTFVTRVSRIEEEWVYDLSCCVFCFFVVDIVASSTSSSSWLLRRKSFAYWLNIN